MNKNLGYYRVGNQVFESKIHALIQATKTNERVNWVFNNDVFDEFDWSTEPTLTIDQLYAQRVRQLREKYDYLILCYSGGSDSNNILETFVREKIKLDEIVTNFIIDATKPITEDNIASRSADNHNAEWDLLTKKRLQYIHDNIPGIKISNFDMSQPILDHFRGHQDGSWVLKCREWANPMSTARYNIIHDTALRKRFDGSKTVGIILGVDKPQFIIRDGALYMHFIDTTANITPMAEHIKAYDNSTVEFFYWSPDSAEILAKQAHIMLKYMKINRHWQSIWDWRTNHPDHPMSKKVRTLREDILKTVIYTTWNSNWFQAEKGTIGWTNKNDRWFFDYFKDTIEYTAWLNGIKYLKDNIAERYMAPLDGAEMEKFKAIYSNMYYIGKVDNAQ